MDYESKFTSFLSISSFYWGFNHKLLLYYIFAMQFEAMNRQNRLLDHIKEPIASELAEFDRHFIQSLKTKVPLLDRITRYIVKRKGKQIRPMFVFLSSKLFSDVSESSFTAAAMIELLHTATLVHDDVVDDANMRRGFFSINALWKNKIAVLVGDYLLSKGLLLAIEKEEFNLLRIMSRAVKDMSEGELLQIEKARKLDIDEAVYFEIIRQKTASLIAAACAAGRAATTQDPVAIETMRSFGEKVGMAFQLKDDLFDYGDEDIGKPLGIDIKEKKLTLPLIYTLNNAGKKEKRHIINTVKRYNHDKQRVRELISLVKARGGMDYARQMMYLYRDEALSLLDPIPPSRAKDALINLVHFVINRKH